MSKVNCESIMPNWSETKYVLGKIIALVFHQKRQEMEREQYRVALDQVAISYDYFVEHAEENRQGDFTNFDTIVASFNHFLQIGELIESTGEYKLNIEGELYKYWVEQFGY